MIDEAIEEQAAAALDQLSNGQWIECKTEVQDAGRFLLLTVEAPQLTSNDLTDEYRLAIASVLNSIIPCHPEQELGSWLVVFTRSGNVFESADPNCAGL